MANLMYGAGLRLVECLRLRVQDIDLAANQLAVRDGKGNKDRVTMLPQVVKRPLLEHLKRVSCHTFRHSFATHLHRILEQIEKKFVELFPGTHAVIELRDCDGATLRAGRVVGPTYDEQKQELDRMKAKTKHL